MISTIVYLQVCPTEPRLQSLVQQVHIRGVAVGNRPYSRLASLRHTALELIQQLTQLQGLRERVRRAEERSGGQRRRSALFPRVRKKRFGAARMRAQWQ